MGVTSYFTAKWKRFQIIDNGKLDASLERAVWFLSHMAY